MEAQPDHCLDGSADAGKQEAIDLLLGVNEHPLTSHQVKLAPDRSYQSWFTQSHLQPPLSADEVEQKLVEAAKAEALSAGGYWQRYYRPRQYTDFEQHFAYKIAGTGKHVHPE